MSPSQFRGLFARDPCHRNGTSNLVARHFRSDAAGQHEHPGERKQ